MEDSQHDDWTPDPTDGRTPESRDDRARRRAVEIAQDARFCMVTSTATGGALHARPMTPQQVSDDLEAWFFISRSSEHAADVMAQPRVNLSFEGSSDWLSVAGRATVVDDRRLVEEMWNPVVEAWFPDGPADEDVVLLRVDADSAEYWKAPGGRAASLLSFVKAKVTGEPMEGESGSFDVA
ncbi:MAG: pyridoxamine 5'-phosphate oxidase family protein [Nocardioides sp.]